jgi:hypothetical protein
MEVWRIFVLVGVVLVLVGLVLYLLPKGYNPFSWFGSLPGDVVFKTDHTTVWMPITSMVILSAVLSAVSWLVQKLVR